MSRPERRHHQDQVAGTNKDASARLFAFSNHTSGYKVVYAPEDVPIVLKTKSGKSGTHVCAQWAPLADAVFARNRNIHAMYVLDTTAMGPVAENEEETTTGALGTTMKAAAKVITRLHPSNATLIGAGPTALATLKYALYTPVSNDAMIGRVLMFLPNTIEGMKTLLKQAKKHSKPNPGATLPKLQVIQSTKAAAKDWEAFLASEAAILSQFFDGTPTVMLLTSKDVWGFLSTKLVDALPKDCPMDFSREDDPRLFQIMFLLSRYTKQVEQEVQEASLEDSTDVVTATTPSAAAPSSATAAAEQHADPNEKVTEASAPPRDDEEQGDTKEIANLLFADLHHIKSGQYRIQGLLKEPRIVGNAHGSLKLSAGLAVNGKPVMVGNYVSFVAQIKRTDEGTVIAAPVAITTIVLPAAEAEAIEVVCRTDEIPPLDNSSMKHSVGCALVRGRKVVLVRSLSGEFTGMRFPLAVHTNSAQSATECAVRATCEQCDITADNFYIHPCMPTVTYSPKPNECCTIFIAVADTYEPPGGSIRDKVEDEPSLTDSYDWVSFKSAFHALQTKAERFALEDVVRAVKRTHECGVYSPRWGLGLFGEPVAPAGTSMEVGVLRVFVSPLGIELNTSNLPVLVQAPVTVHFIGAEDEDEVAVNWVQQETEAFEAARSNNNGGGDVAPLQLSIILDPQYDLNYAAEELLPKITAPFQLRMEFITLLGDLAEELAVPYNGKILGETHIVSQAMDALGISDIVVASRSCPSYSTVIKGVVKAASENAIIVPSMANCINPPAEEEIATPQIVFTHDYSRELPFVPKDIFEKLVAQNSSLAKELGDDVHLLQCSGHCWLSSRFAYRGNVRLGEGKLHIDGGDPWWCVMPEAEWPADTDPTTWHQAHGDRCQKLHFVLVAQDPAHCQQIVAKLDTLLDSLLCKPSEEKYWNRKEDPFPEWQTE